MIPFPGNPPPDQTTDVPASTALARATDDGYRLALEPSSFKEAQTIAAMIHKAGLCGVRSPEEAMAKIMTGRALGIPTMTALRAVHIIENKPALEAKLKVALVLRHPECELFQLVERGPERCTYVAKRRGRPEVKLTFTIQEAQQARLTDRGKDDDAKKMNNWNRFPADMLAARACSRLADIVFPDATLGMPTTDDAYDGSVPSYPGEMTGEVVDAAPPVAPPQAAPSRDFAADVAALKGTLALAKSDAMLKEWRTAAARLSEAAGEPYQGELRAAYNEHVAAVKVGGK